MSGNVIPLRKVQLIGRTLSIPFAPEDIRDGVYYELVTAGELDSIERRRTNKHSKPASKGLQDLLSNAGAQVGDYILVLRRIGSRTNND